MQRTLETKLASLQGPEWDSSDEEEETSKIRKPVSRRRSSKPTKVHDASDSSGDEPEIFDKTGKSGGNSKQPSAVIYLGHLPENFEEEQISGFLSQFGNVLKCRLSRSKRSGRPRGYGFIEFVDPSVAVIVADTMTGYILMDKRLICHVVPMDKIHPRLFDGSGKKFVVRKGSEVLSDRMRQKMSTVAGLKHISKSLIKRDKTKRQKLIALGIEYVYPELKEVATTNKEEEVQHDREALKQDSVEQKMASDIPWDKDEVMSKKKRVKKNITTNKNKEEFEKTVISQSNDTIARKSEASKNTVNNQVLSNDLINESKSPSTKLADSKGAKNSMNLKTASDEKKPSTRRNKKSKKKQEAKSPVHMKDEVVEVPDVKKASVPKSEVTEHAINTSFVGKGSKKRSKSVPEKKNSIIMEKDDCVEKSMSKSKKRAKTTTGNNIALEPDVRQRQGNSKKNEEIKLSAKKKKNRHAEK